MLISKSDLLFFLCIPCINKVRKSHCLIDIGIDYKIQNEVNNKIKIKKENMILSKELVHFHFYRLMKIVD